MKLFYKSYAPDVSAGSTTIKDVGKKRSPRKLITLWSFLMALLMMVPVGAMAEDGADPDNPLTGDIGYKTFNTPNGSVYLNGVTGGQLHILAEGVTIYVAGNNSLKGSTRSHPALELGHSGISTNNSLTIKYWNKDNNVNYSSLELNGADYNALGNGDKPGIDLEQLKRAHIME